MPNFVLLSATQPKEIPTHMQNSGLNNYKTIWGCYHQVSEKSASSSGLVSIKA